MLYEVFLKTFRLPGEAQCIDRLMEAFSKGLYEQQQKQQLKSRTKKAVKKKTREKFTEKGLLENCPTVISWDENDTTICKKLPPASVVPLGTKGGEVSELSEDKTSSQPPSTVEQQQQKIDQINHQQEELQEPPSQQQHDNNNNNNTNVFHNADTIYILAFSTIMLNTDLHNSNIRSDRKMTMEGFVKNNRGINNGSDLPAHFLKELYTQIKENEIQVQEELSDVVLMDDSCPDGLHKWDSVLSKSHQVATPFFTPSSTARQSFFRAGVHERDMFLSIFPSALQCISAVFVCADENDDDLVWKALEGFQRMADICIYFQMEEHFNNVVVVLLGYGVDYVTSSGVMINNEGSSLFDISRAGNYGEGASKNVAERTDEFNNSNVGGTYDQTLLGILSSSAATRTTTSPRNKTAAANLFIDPLAHHQHLDLKGASDSANHRGLLSLHYALTLIRLHTPRIREAWPMLIECMFALRDINALPHSMIELDDFADCRGVTLPLSIFAQLSHQRMERFMLSVFSDDILEDDEGGFWSSLFGSSSKASTTNEASSFNSIKKASDLNTISSPFSMAILGITTAAQLDQIFFRSGDLSMSTQVIRVLLDSIHHSFPERLRTDDSSNNQTDGSQLVYELNYNSEEDDDPLFEHHAVFALELAFRALFTNRERASDILPMFLSQLKSILAFVLSDDKMINDVNQIHSRNDKDGTKQIWNKRYPYLLERIVVTVMRCCIHFFDLHEVKPSLLSSLHLIESLPANFVCELWGRLGCGLAIILRSSYGNFNCKDDWVLMKKLLEKAAQSEPDRGFVFDGIACCVEVASSNENCVSGDSSSSQNNEDIKQSLPPLLPEGAEALVGVLLGFISGEHCEVNASIRGPAMGCVEKLQSFISRSNSLAPAAVTDGVISNSGPSTQADSILHATNIPVTVSNETLWMNNATALCKACFSTNDPTSAMHGVDHLQRLLLTTNSESLKDNYWFDVIDMLTSEQPTFENVRVQHCELLGKILLVMLPYLSSTKENLKHLEEVVHRVSSIVGNNLRDGRSTDNGVGILFEKTVQIVTNMTNVLCMEQFDSSGVGFCSWAGETFLSELKKFGAAGGSARMIAATSNTIKIDVVN